MESFENYLESLKTRRDEDQYQYTDGDFEKHINYIKECWKNNLSVYKCLEFMWFEIEIKN